MKSGQFSGHSSLRICASKVRQLAVEEGGGARRAHFDKQVVELAQEQALISCRRGADGSGHKYTEICGRRWSAQPCALRVRLRISASSAMCSLARRARGKDAQRVLTSFSRLRGHGVSANDPGGSSVGLQHTIEPRRTAKRARRPSVSLPAYEQQQRFKHSINSPSSARSGYAAG